VGTLGKVLTLGLGFKGRGKRNWLGLRLRLFL